MQDWIAIAALLVAAVSLLLNLIKGGKTEVWKLSDRLNKLDKEREENRRLLYQYVEERHDEALRHFGETVSSHVEHTRQLELELYKSFVRLPAFETTIKSIQDTINIRFDKLEERLDRVDRRS